MKLLLALVALAPTLAQAEPAFYCKDAHPRPGHDVVVSFSPSVQHADVSNTSADGTRATVAELGCSYVAIPEGQKRLDQPYLTCSDNRLGSGGYTVLLGYSGSRIVATVYQGKLGGPLAKLTCGRN
jgi:hypothetical protein